MGRSRRGLSLALQIWLMMMLVQAGLVQASAGQAQPERPERAGALYGQLVMVGFTGTRPGDPGVEQVAEDLRSGRAGGVILFERNIVDEQQVRALTTYLRRAASGPPPLIAVDEEGGKVQRLIELKAWPGEPSARWVGANRTANQARNIYRRLAAELSGLGFNLNLAPVVDLDTGWGNPVIGRLGRSFGSDPKTVTRYAAAFVEAHREHGVLTALKHWPGHGSSRADPHVATVDVTDTWHARERQPFASLIDMAKADMIMTGHIGHRAWGEGKRRPASLSAAAVQFDLRQRLGFDGVVVTDDVQMASALAGRSLAAAVVLALDAGNDIVLIANMLDPRADAASHAVAAIQGAVADGRLDRASLLASHRRVMALKRRLSPVIGCNETGCGCVE